MQYPTAVGAGRYDTSPCAADVDDFLSSPEETSMTPRGCKSLCLPLLAYCDEHGVLLGLWQSGLLYVFCSVPQA